MQSIHALLFEIVWLTVAFESFSISMHRCFRPAKLMQTYSVYLLDLQNFTLFNLKIRCINLTKCRLIYNVTTEDFYFVIQDFLLTVNNIPAFTQNLTVINVTLEETLVLVLQAEDADGDELTFDVPNIPPGATFNYTGNMLYFVWPVDSADEVSNPERIVDLVIRFNILQSVTKPFRQLRTLPQVSKLQTKVE